MTTALWIVLGAFIAGCAGFLLFAVLQLLREARASDATWFASNHPGSLAPHERAHRPDAPLAH